MSEETTAPARQTPGPMNTWIGQWSEDGKTFTVKAGPIAGANQKAIRDTIKTLGFGKYDILTGRTATAEYKEKVSSSFSLS